MKKLAAGWVKALCTVPAAALISSACGKPEEAEEDHSPERGNSGTSLNESAYLARALYMLGPRLYSAHHSGDDQPGDAIMSSSTKHYVSKSRHCVICDGDHKCCYCDDGFILCGRVTGEVAGYRFLGKAKGDPQWSQYRREDDPLLNDRRHDSRQHQKVSNNGKRIDWQDKATQFASMLTPDLRAELAQTLGLPETVFELIVTGFNPNGYRSDLERAESCWTFPYWGGDGETIIGVATRFRNGHKEVMKGGRLGLILPDDWSKRPGPVFCPEGPSDTLTLAAMGLAAVGRPSNMAGVEHLAELLKDEPKDRHIIILGEYDAKRDGKWPGRDGAVKVATELAAKLSRSVQWALPPQGQKDVRQWTRSRKLGPECSTDDWRSEGQIFLTDIEQNCQQIKPDNETTRSWESPIRFAEFPRPEFPVECLSVNCVNFVSALAHFTQTPLDLAAMLLLGLAGAALATKIRVVARPGWVEPLNLYAVVALPPGNRKSAVFAEMLAPELEYERKESERLRPEIADKASARRTLEARLKNAETTAAKAKDAGQRANAESEAKGLARELSTFEVPVAPQFFADDVTVEKLANLMAEHDGRMLIASAEGTIFEIAKGRYCETPNFDVFLKGHAGDPIRTNRVGREQDYIKQPALSMAITVQPDVIAGLMSETSLKGRGFLARPLYSLPDSLVGKRHVRTEPVSAEVSQAYHNIMSQLWQIPGTVDEHGKPAAHLIRLSQEADDELARFEEWLEPKLAEELACMADWPSKLAGAVVRLSGILHVMDALEAKQPWSSPIAFKTVQAAVCIAEDYLLPHAKAAFGLMGADENLENAKRLLKWLKDSGRRSFSKRDAHRAIPNNIQKVGDLEPVLKLLEQHGYIRSEQTSTSEGGKSGRKPSPSFEVNPALWNEGRR